MSLIPLPKGRMAYTILQTVKTDDGQFIPCICIENQGGYYKTDWAWGKDLDIAEQCADEKNAEMGLSKEEAWKIVASSMKPIAQTREGRF